MPTRFAHLCFHVNDLARAQEFYTRHFGLTVEKQVPGLDGRPAAFLALNGSTFLELWEQDNPAGMHGHVAFWVEDIEAFAQAMARAGIAVSPRNLRPTGNTIAFLSDPDGNTIELLCAPR